MVEHQGPDAARLGRHDVHSQEPGEIAEEQLSAFRRQHEVVLGGQARHYGNSRGREGLVGNGDLAAELVRKDRAQTRFGHQLELEELGRRTRHFFLAAGRLPGYGDQRHSTPRRRA